MRTARYTIAQASSALPLPMIAPASPGRAALLISPQDPAAAVYVTPEPGAAAGSGICIPIGAPALLLRVEDVGDILMGPWYASTTASQAVVVVDVAGCGGRP